MGFKGPQVQILSPRFDSEYGNRVEWTAGPQRGPQPAERGGAIAKHHQVHLNASVRATGTLTGRLTTTREFLQQNPWYTGAVVFLILVPPVIVAMLGDRVPAWASVALAWFLGFLAAVLGIRALPVIHERDTS
jgi:hypothetical protein